MRNRCRVASSPRGRGHRVFPPSSSFASFLVLTPFFFFLLYFPVFPSRGRCSIKIPREPRPAGNVVGEARRVHVESSPSRGIEAEFRGTFENEDWMVEGGGRPDDGTPF